MPSLTDDLRRIAPDAFWTVHRLGKTHATPVPVGFTQVRGPRVKGRRSRIES